MSTYRYSEPTPRTFNVLPVGDYQAVITEAEEPYVKDNGNHVLKVTLSIQPSGSKVFYAPWTGKTAAGEFRDNIGELLLAANRVPANKKEEPEWTKLIGAKVKVRLKVEPGQNGEERNVIHWVYTPKQAGKPAVKGQSAATDEFLKARAKQEIASGGEPEPDDLPY